MKIAIMGAGAMGSLIGGLLAEDNQEVILVDPWEEHVNTMNEKGLSMQVTGEEARVVKIKATTDPAEVGIADAVIFLVKGTTTDESIRKSLPMIGEDTIVLTLQNGIGNADKIAEVVDVSNIAFGVIEFSSVMIGPGAIRYELADGVIFAKTADGKDNQKFKNLVEQMSESALNVYISDDVDFRVWDKLIINANYNSLCAITGLTMGELMDQQQGMELMEDVTKELVAVANAKGIGLEFEAGMEHIKDLGAKVRNHYPSLTQDVARKVPTEIDFINGAIVREGKKNNIPTPVNETIVKLIKVIENTYEYGKEFSTTK